MRARILAVATALVLAGPAWGQVTGVPVPLPTVPNGSGAGTDASSNPMALLPSMLKTCTLSAAGSYYFMNSSGATIQVVFDDGLGGTATIVPLGNGASIGSQGGDTSPPMGWFIGRIRVFASVSSAFVPGRVVGACA